MNNTFYYEFNLVPTSPIIMFQKDGMLRATEVKPKLDKFILTKINKEEHKNWVSDKNSLNYKMSISSYKNKEEFVWNEYINNKNNNYFDIYYGDKKGEKAKYLYLLYPTVKIVCLIPELLEEIKKSIDDFFVTYNFGTFQGKGFGGFIVKDKTLSESKILECLRKNYGCKIVAKVNYDEKELSLNNLNRKFNFIKSFYSVMKSGMNLGDRFYHRSYLFEYMHSKGIDNEKAYIKEKGIAPSLSINKRKNENQQNKNPHYVRALLGVGNFIDFRTSAVNPKEKQKITIKNKNIERYPSPVIFKIIDGNIYILMNNKQEVIYNEEFTFKNKDTGRFVNINTIDGTFDKDDFLKSYINNCWNRLDLKALKGGRKVTICE